MRAFPPALRAHLESGATTLCQCWKIERSDGLVQGFTDHDGPLSFDNIVFQASSGLSASEAVSSLGLRTDSSEVDGALQSDAIEEEALHRGVYDHAKVSIYLVNWQDVSLRYLLRIADIGEITCEDGAFRAELRGLTHRFGHVSGRLFENSCDANLGDPRCGVSLQDPQLRATGDVLELLDSQTFIASGLTGFDRGWFDHGVLTWETGENHGKTVEIDIHVKSAGRDKLRIWLPTAFPIKQGDQFSIVAGCDKQFRTCCEKFSNTLNFRGFPHMPGNDASFKSARADRVNLGRPLVR